MPAASFPSWPERPEFAAMPEVLKARGRWKRFEAGDLLFRLGDQPTEMFYIAQGEVRLRRYSPDGNEIVLQRAVSAFLAEGSLEAPAYHCDAVAVQATLALVFPLAIFRESIADAGEFRACWISHLLREVRRSRSQCQRLTLKTAAARVLHYIECEGRNGVVELRYSRKAWAAELGLSHEALYRTLARLERDGTLLLRGNMITRRAC